MKAEQMIAVVALAILSWGSFQVYSMNAELSVISYRVEENYKMIKPMWQDFLIRSDQVRVSK